MKGVPEAILSKQQEPQSKNNTLKIQKYKIVPGGLTN